VAHHPPPRWTSHDGLLVARFRHGPLWNFSYLVACAETGEAAVIDPAWDASAILQAAAGQALRITTVLLTHSHSDHANGVAELVAASGARSFVHVLDQAGLQAHAPDATSFSGDEAFLLGQQRVTARHTPGHTAGSVTFQAGTMLFTGDTLAVGSPGTPGPEPGSLELLWQSTQALAALGGQFVVHPGHDSGPEPSATLSVERDRNPGLLAATLDEFRAAVERATGRSHA